jgi:hypothetical protein
MSDKSTTDGKNRPPEDGPEQAGGEDGGRPSPPVRRGFRRALATVALVAAAAVAVSYWLGHKDVTLTIVIKKGRTVAPIRSADIKLRSRDGDHVRAHIHLTDLGEDFDRHVRQFELQKGHYVIETRVIHSDSSVRRTEKKVKLEENVRLTVTLR